MKHVLLFESYNRRMNIENTIYSYDDENAGYFSGSISPDIPNVTTWLSENGYTSYQEEVVKYGLPIAFLDRIEIEEEHRNNGYGNQGLDEFINQAEQHDAVAVVLVADKGNTQLEGFNLESWYESKGFEVLCSHEYGSLMILKLSSDSDYNQYEDTDNNSDY